MIRLTLENFLMSPLYHFVIVYKSLGNKNVTLQANILNASYLNV